MKKPVKHAYIIREKKTRNILVKYRTITGKLKKAIFSTRRGAVFAIENQIKTHWLLSRFEWFVEDIGDEWKLPENPDLLSVKEQK